MWAGAVTALATHSRAGAGKRAEKGTETEKSAESEAEAEAKTEEKEKDQKQKKKPKTKHDQEQLKEWDQKQKPDQLTSLTPLPSVPSSRSSSLSTLPSTKGLPGPSGPVYLTKTVILCAPPSSPSFSLSLPRSGEGEWLPTPLSLVLRLLLPSSACCLGGTSSPSFLLNLLATARESLEPDSWPESPLVRELQINANS